MVNVIALPCLSTATSFTPHGTETTPVPHPFQTLRAGILGAGRRRGEFVESVTRANTCAVMRGDWILSRAGALYGRT